MVKKRANLILLVITSLLYGMLLYQAILMSYNDYTTELIFYVSLAFFPPMCALSNVFSIIYFIREKTVENLMMILISIGTITGFLIILYIFGSIMSHF